MAKSFLGIELFKGVKSALFYNTGSGDRVIAIPMKEITKAMRERK